MNIPTEFYPRQNESWPREGRHLLAHFDDNSIIVYQAYRSDIGHFAARNGYFGGEFSFSRMSWFKPNFLWMMYRSGWGTKSDQEVTLAVRIRREFFESVLERAVPSSHDPDLYVDAAEWKDAVASSDVRLQWDPDHSPSGSPVRRKAVQLGLRDKALREYGRDAILEIEDISDFVAEQRANASPERHGNLRTPVERIYIPASPDVARRLKISASE
ncbi:MAG: DUF4291 domain-containing protein [Candidatus Kapaibacterium sp.]